ncbi:hypothetical protein EIN_093500 [Entamoeba invadens IP1]|uniref:Uncharacterized protein n=1 Tax=Entamoeba invadens IP1 TaxID=370355 RepID=A0A0A1U374_ENTIV|nr:hypothetical protein EIN_093500 [Entamoeba invadens IP1]ELP87193.1 hypothetical protein EIN_093500 [Entamoeba invadens IP1]|eukprot:XP_004253964.1 hypothetical protein EIN_093500 [Entamoeba invadens IP1]
MASEVTQTTVPNHDHGIGIQTKQQFLVESEIVLEELIIKYRKIEMEKMRQKVSFLEIIPIYKQMNAELESLIQHFKERRNTLTFQQLNSGTPEENTSRSPLPNIFSEKETIFPLQTIQTPINSSLPTSDDITPLKNVSTTNTTAAKLPTLLFSPLQNKNTIKLPKAPVTAIQQIQATKHNGSRHRSHKKDKNCSNQLSDDETEINSDPDTETLVSSCSDTVEELVEKKKKDKVDKMDKDEKKKDKEKKPRKRITMPKKGEKKKEKKKETKEDKKDDEKADKENIEKDKKSDWLQPLSTLNQMKKEGDLVIVPLNIKKDELPQETVNNKQDEKVYHNMEELFGNENKGNDQMSEDELSMNHMD